MSIEEPGRRGWPSPEGWSTPRPERARDLPFRPVRAERVEPAEALDALHHRVDEMAERLEAKLGAILVTLGDVLEVLREKAPRDG